MAHNKLDEVHRKRIDGLVQRAVEHGEIDYNDFFISEKVAQTVDDQKTLIESYNEGQLLGTLPFTPTVYVQVCPFCITPPLLANFRSFVASGRVIPILMSNYSLYDEAVIDAVANLNHISAWEYRGFRYLQLAADHEITLCGHCASKIFSEMETQVTQRRNGERYLTHIEALQQNIFPYLAPDAKLIKSAASACAGRRLGELGRLAKLSFAVHKLRTAQAFSAEVLVKEEELSSLPEGISAETDEARLISAEMREQAGRGLGLNVPTDLSVEAFLEIVGDYQPRITKVMDDLMAEPLSMTTVDLAREIVSINNEIERIKGLKRHTVLEAGISFSKRNSSLVYATLLGGALGLVNAAAGCTAAAATFARKFAKEKGIVKEVPELKRLARQIARDTQPYTDELLGFYLGGKRTAVRVLSLRKRIQGRAERDRAA